MVQNALLQEALRLAALGLKVLPLRPRDKRPLTEHGVHDSSSSKEQIEKWWQETPTANLGLSCEGLLVVDIDDMKCGWPGDDKKANDLSTCPIQQTPRGGAHYLARDPQKEFGNTASKLAKGVDTRGSGGYIVVAPSQIGDQRYTWVEGIDSLEEIPEVFPWLREDLLKIKETGGFRGEGGFLGDRPIADGEQNDTLHRIGSWMRRHGFGESSIRATLLEESRTRCVDKDGKPWPHPEERVEKIARSCMRYEPDIFATAAMEDAPPSVEEDTFSDPGRFPAHLLDEAPGFLSEVMDFTLATAPRPQPVYALAGALALQSTLVGRKIRDEENLRANILALVVGRSGSGKDRPRQVNREILDAIGASDELLGTEEVQSGNGVYTIARTQPVCLLQLDEMGKMLLRIKQSRSDALANVISTLMKLYSASGGPCKLGGYVDPKRNFIVEQPYCVVFGTTVTESFAASLTTEELHDGFLSRTLVFTSEEFPIDVDFKWTKVPQSIVDMAGDWHQFQTQKGNLVSVNPVPRVVRYSAEALEAMQDFRGFCYKLSLEHTLWTRAMEKTKKVAILHEAATQGPGMEVISARAFRWAAQLVEYQTRETLWVASQWISDTWLEALNKRFIRWMRSKNGTVTLTQFTRAFQSVNKKTRAELIDTMVQTGQLVAKKHGNLTKLSLTSLKNRGSI